MSKFKFILIGRVMASKDSISFLSVDRRKDCYGIVFHFKNGDKDVASEFDTKEEALNCLQKMYDYLLLFPN